MPKLNKPARTFDPLHNKRGERIGFIHPDYTATITPKARHGRSKKTRR